MKDDSVRKYNYVEIIKQLRKQAEQINLVILDIVLNRYEYEFSDKFNTSSELLLDIESIKDGLNTTMNETSSLQKLSCDFCNKDVLFCNDWLKLGIIKTKNTCLEHVSRIDE